MPKINNRLLPMPKQLSLIEHNLEGAVIPQRPIDGYINATAMCKKAGKSFADYNRLSKTKEFINELSTAMGIPIAELIQIVMGGNEKKIQGAWVHPQVAINLAQWLSPKFSVQVSQWIFDWMKGKSSGYMPVHVKRYMENRAKIPPTHFSMLNEIYLHLIAPLEDMGYILPDKMVPDASTGRMFSQFLRKEGIDVDNFPTYQHEFMDNKRPTVSARLYPLKYLEKFRKYFYEVWMPTRSITYFSERSPEAIPLLEVVISELPTLPQK